MQILGTFFLLICVFINFLSPLNCYADPILIKDSVFQLAQSKKISDSRAWKKLLHIEPNFMGFSSNQISDKNFYLSFSDEYKKYTELEATLIAFTEPAEKYSRLIPHPLDKKNTTQILDHSQHPLCRFPARLMFLKSQLQEATEYWNSLPKLNCVFQNIYLEALNPESVSFVFSSYYSDSPGSAFGHTFFRINRKAEAFQIKQELLDYGVGYAANVTVSNQFIYALYGLIGGFKGAWTNLPYYYKVREYNDFEARDLWSYDLNLQPDEVKMLLLHFWEVGPHYYTYYFFTQNCAYHMLTMLEAAAPRLHLTEHVPFYYVIPSDSMKSLFFENNLVQNVSFRPSIRKVFLERVKRLNPTSFEIFIKYVQDNNFSDSLKNISDQEQALLLDAAIDLVDLHHPNLNPQNDKDLYLKKEGLLQRRAQLNFISPHVNLKPQTLTQPENSHGSSRVGLIYLQDTNVKYGLLEYRFALHDLQDPQWGLPQNSQLEFFNFKFKILPTYLPSRLQFQEMNLFKVFNLNPINFFENKASWGADLGIQNKKAYCSEVDDTCLLIGSLIKYGVSQNIFSQNFTLWALGTINLRYGATLLNSKYYAAPGFELGFLYRFNDEVSIFSQFSREYPLNRLYQQNYELQYRQSVGRNTSFGFGIENDFSKILAFYYF